MCWTGTGHALHCFHSHGHWLMLAAGGMDGSRTLLAAHSCHAGLEALGTASLAGSPDLLKLQADAAALHSTATRRVRLSGSVRGPTCAVRLSTHCAEARDHNLLSSDMRCVLCYSWVRMCMTPPPRLPGLQASALHPLHHCCLWHLLSCCPCFQAYSWHHNCCCCGCCCYCTSRPSGGSCSLGLHHHNCWCWGMQCYTHLHLLQLC